MSQMWKDKIQKNLARKLRKEQAPAEIWLWQQLLNRQFEGYKFRRQSAPPSPEGLGLSSLPQGEG